jgi:phage-related protein
MTDYSEVYRIAMDIFSSIHSVCNSSPRVSQSLTLGANSITSNLLDGMKNGLKPLVRLLRPNLIEDTQRCV